VALALVLLLALAGSAWWSVRQLHERHRLDDATAGTRSAPRVAAADLVTLLSTGDAAAEADRARLVAAATPSFAKQWRAIATQFDALAKGGVSATTKVRSTAVQALGSGAATVLVAADVTVRNGKRHQTTAYRMLVDLARHGDGWILDNLRLVP